MKTFLITSALITALLTNGTTASATVPPMARISPVKSVTEPATYKLTVTFSNVNSRTGKIYLAVANDEASFRGSAFRKTRIDVPTTGEISVSFEGLPAGTYAVQAYQDLNDNQKLDRSGQMPTEPFGFSILKMLMGPPTYNGASFEVKDNKTIDIKWMGL